MTEVFFYGDRLGFTEGAVGSDAGVVVGGVADRVAGGVAG